MAIRDVILLTFFVLSLPVCFVRPFYGIVLWTVVAFLNPQSYLWGAADMFPWAMAVAIPTLAGFLAFERGFARLACREFYLIFALWVWFTITSVVSSNSSLFMHHAADTWFRWRFVSKILLMTAVTIASTHNFRRLRALVLVIAGCFGFLVLKSLPFIIASQGEFRVYGPSNSMVADNNDVGLDLDMTLPLFFLLAQTESNNWLRRLFGFICVATIPTIFFTYSRGAMVGLVVVLGLMLLRLKQRWILVPLVGLAIVVALLFAPEGWRRRMNPDNALDASARSRLNSWMFSWSLALESPVTGGGFETFTPELFTRYAENPKDVHGPHSIYFGVLAEHGFVGMLLYLILVASVFATAQTIIRRGRLSGDHLFGNYARMFQLSIVGFLVPGFFVGRTYFDYFFTVVACVAILNRLSLAEWTQMPDGISTLEETLA